MNNNAVECFESIIGSSTPAENRKLEDRVKEWLRDRNVGIFDDLELEKDGHLT